MLLALVARNRRVAPARALEYSLGFWNVGTLGAFAKITFGPQGRQFFRNRYIDKLVQCNTLGFRHAPGFV